MVIWICNCGYTWVIEDCMIPSAVFGPIFSPDSVIGKYWMHKPQLISAHQWYENYSDCAHQWFKERFK